jgi:predicted dienelactone hydrolase
MRKADTFRIRTEFITLLALACLNAGILSGCGGGTSTPPPLLSISFSGGSSKTIVQGQSVTITAIIKNDASAQGVTWKLTGPGSLSKQTTMSVEYDAPTSVASNVTAMITATAVADPNRSAPFTVTITPPTLISVSLSATTATVAVSTSVMFTATVQNDSANRGVTWNLTQGGIACSPGCGSVAPASTPSDAPVTYTAPATVPTNPTLALTATSVSDSSKSALATLTIVPPSIVVSVSPKSVLLGVNASQQFTATVQNDPTNRGVTWALNQGGTVCSAGCGTLSATSSASGMPITYTAPATVPVDPVVSIIATSVADTAATIGTPITITVGTVKLAPASLRFGTVLVGTSSPPQTTTLTNTGNTTLSITSITIPVGPNQGDWSQSNTCGPNIAAGQFCTITVIFKPTATGIRNTTVSITDDSADSPQQVPLSGKGRNPTAAALRRSALSTYQTVDAPSPTGPNHVGTRVIDIVDSTRDDPFLANGTKRELLVRLWYPAFLSQACQPAQYTSPRIWSHFSHLSEMRLPEVRTNSCLDAPITNGAHPVVVFTPGYTATFTDYTFLFEDLASRGYVVASVDHTYEATAVEFPDGRFIESVFGSHLVGTLRGDEQALSFAVSVRLEDLKFVVSALEGLNARPDSPFNGKLDVSRFALAGHSLGGLTAILGIEQEPHFKAAVVIDGVLPDDLRSEIQTPVLMLVAGNDNWSESRCRLGSRLRGPQFVVNFPSAEHVTPSDAVWLAKGTIKTGNMGPEKTIAAVRDYMAAFLDANLRGQPMNSLLTGPTPDSSEVVVTTREQLLCGKP